MQLELEREREKFRSIQEIARAVGSTFDLDELLSLVVGKITDLMRADRSTLYVMDDSGAELWTKVIQADDLKEIRLRVGQGIAGWVAKTGETVNIEDAYKDPRFSPETDQKSGYRTSSILCTPMKDNLGNIIGVVQVLNKKGGVFTKEDEELLAALTSQASIAIENSKLYWSVVKNNRELLETHQKLERRVKELDFLLEMEQEVNASTFLDELLDRLLLRVTELIGAEAASILIEEEKKDTLFFRSAIGEKREAVRHVSVAMGEGIAGWVAKHEKPALVSHPASDPRHNIKLAERLGFHPRNILCVPLSGYPNVRGAIELLNKVGREQFDTADLRLLSLIAGRVAQVVQLAHIKENRIRESRLASIGQMLSSVLHDLKTPMTIISGYAQLMAQSQEENVRQEYSDKILRQFEVLSAMTREVLAFARGESNVLIRKVFLQRYLADLAEGLKHEFAGKNIELCINEKYNGVGYMDEVKFRRVFHNLGRNAAEAMPSGGRFTITVDAVDDQLVFAFEDTGTGIPSEIEGRLFEAFASAGKEDGTGLGLAVVKKIVDEHQGKISYSSRTGQGTTFVISLPLVRTDVATGEFPVDLT